MSYDKRFLGGPSVLTALSGGALTKLTQFVSRSLQVNHKFTANTASGALVPGWVGSFGSAPLFEGETHECARLLAALNVLYGSSIGATSGTDTYQYFDAYYVQRAVMGGAEVASGHIRLRVDRGLVAATRITANARQEASVSVSIYANSTTGSDDPFAVATGQSLPANAYAVDQKFQLGPVVVQGTTYGDVETCAVNMGQSFESMQASGDKHATTTTVSKVEPTADISFLDMSRLSTFNSNPVALSGDNIIYLRAKDRNGNVIADATTAHIAITLNDGAWVLVSVPDGQGNVKPTLQFRASSSYDGSDFVEPITVTTGVAIP